MESYSIYEDIKQRTNGDIYIGVVGPVRCGKSTFITNFMQNFVVPNIKNRNVRQRTIDELPQSADGKTIMTTQPKFVPNEAVKINIQNVEMNVRMIDCVGYMVAGAMGHEENDRPRMVKTPWTENEMQFDEAAEFGTKKVITEHSTFGIAMTTDGSISDIPRESYVEAEERIVEDIKKRNKPFILLVNSKHPQADETQKLVKNLQQKYSVSAMAINAQDLTNNQIEKVFEKILLEFPIRSLKVKMPSYLQALSYDDPIIALIIGEIKKFASNAKKIGQIDKTIVAFSDDGDFTPVSIGNIKLGEGSVYFEVMPKPHLFYKVLSQQCGAEICDDFHLVRYIKDLAHAKREYCRLEDALKQVEMTGYGVVQPSIDDLTLDDPQIVKQGSRFGVKIKASAPSLHLIKVDVETELNPLVGTEQQSKDLVTYLTNEFEQNPANIWETNMFGKSLHTMVADGINSKICLMPTEAQRKMQRTLAKIVNEGKGGIICILL